MKKLFLILALLASVSLEAQYVTTFAKNIPETQEDGIFYYLPRTVIKLEFTIEETDYYIGPYAEFTSKLMGINDYIKETKSEYVIKHVDIQVSNEADPDAVYHIVSDEKSKEPMPNITLDVDGVIMAIGYDSIPTRSRICRKSFTDNDIQANEKPNIKFIEIFDSDIEIDDDDDEKGSSAPKITKEVKAKAALDKITEIRNAYYELVSGSNEVAAGLSYMVENLQKLENEYISLFKGKIAKHTYKKVYYYTPDKNNLNGSVSITRMSSSEGIVELGNKGEVVKIQFENKRSLANINPISNDSKNASQTNKVFYRIPAESNVKILQGNKVLAEKQLTINQFGDIKTITAKGNRVLFNPNTGQIISIVK